MNLFFLSIRRERMDLLNQYFSILKRNKWISLSTLSDPKNYVSIEGEEDVGISGEEQTFLFPALNSSDETIFQMNRRMKPVS